MDFSSPPRPAVQFQGEEVMGKALAHRFTLEQGQEMGVSEGK